MAKHPAVIAADLAKAICEKLYKYDENIRMTALPLVIAEMIEGYPDDEQDRAMETVIFLAEKGLEQYRQIRKEEGE